MNRRKFFKGTALAPLAVECSALDFYTEHLAKPEDVFPIKEEIFEGIEVKFLGVSKVIGPGNQPHLVLSFHLSKNKLESYCEIDSALARCVPKKDRVMFLKAELSMFAENIQEILKNHGLD